ncbi:SH3 domain-containing protein [Candidatus Electrothrix aarhusensis]|uniref:SH3 domain-containing protein n=1 Tax=Candidatus Electrothrix aarhusensis TaxID=1859131 RepID=A0A444J561_9BACT|nr:SH3 domain-containing protein [Candidatus Electrothrix aarhusensis]
MYMGRSRTALTSGGKDEKVQDAGEDGHSVFAQAFLEVLRKNKEILDGNRLFDTLKITVVDVALQTPRYNYIPGTGENSGDFLLVPKEILRKNLRLSVDVFRGTSPAIQPVGADFMAMKNVRIRRQPQFTSQQVGMLKKGDAIWVVGEVNEQPWYLVDCGKGQQEQGYIYSSYLQEKTGGKVRGKSREGTAVAAVKRTEPPVSRELSQKDKTIGQYIDHGDGTITDTKTGLMWKRCSEGLSGKNCEKGKAEEYTWNDAVKRFKNVDYAGYSDWRLPTIDELKSLVYCSKGVKDKDDGECNDGSERPTINQQVFPNTSLWYWSGSPYAGASDLAWYVNLFYGGYSNYVGRDANYAVRLVRGGQ